METETSFDGTGSFAMLYLWMIFGYLGVLLNCDLQKMISQHAVLRHALAIIAFYFLFTALDPNNNVHVIYVFLKTIIVYCLFVLATKTRWYFSGIALLLLFIDQVIKNHISYLEKQEAPIETRELLTKTRRYILWLLIAVIIIGNIDYIIKQKSDHSVAFSWTTFILGKNSCGK